MAISLQDVSLWRYWVGIDQSSNLGNMGSCDLPTLYTALPLPPVDLMLVAAGSSWLSIAWGPSPNPNPPVDHYRVEYKLTFELMGMETVATQRYLNITGLYPNATYQVGDHVIDAHMTGLQCI